MKIKLITLCTLLLASVFFWGCSEQEAKETSSEEQSSKSLSENFAHYPNLITERGIVDEANDLLMKAMNFYSEKNYAGALPLYEEILTTEPQNSSVNFYTGVSYLGTNNTDDAIQKLNYVIEEGDPTFSNPSKWYLALAYLEDGNKVKAVPLLAELREDRKYGEQAEGLLKIIPEANSILSTENSSSSNILVMGQDLVKPDEYRDLGINKDISIHASADYKNLYIRYNRMYNNNCTIRLFNDNGELTRALNRKGLKQKEEVELSLKYLPAGIYTLQIMMDGGKVVKQKIRLQ